MIRTIGFRRLAAAAVALIALSPFADALAQKSVTVLANYTFHGRHSPFFVALDKGYFTEAGFKADVQPATGSGFVISAIESGKADYGLADASTTMQAIAKGSKVKGFQVYMDISTNGLASLTPIPTPESALGKTIAVSPTDSTRVIYPIILKQKGLDPSKINWVAATPATYITLLLSGQADLIAATVDGEQVSLSATAIPTGIWAEVDPRSSHLAQTLEHTWDEPLVPEHVVSSGRPEHVAALAHAFAEAFDEDVQLLLRFRGLPSDAPDDGDPWRGGRLPMQNEQAKKPPKTRNWGGRSRPNLMGIPAGQPPQPKELAPSAQGDEGCD